MKLSQLKLFYTRDRVTVANGFTLIELLMAISILSVTATMISYAVSQMISSNQQLAKEQNRRVEASRALELIAADVAISTIDTTGRAAPTGVTGTIILDMDIANGDAQEGTTDTVKCTTDTSKNRIIYSLQTNNSGEAGPKVVYRYGLISSANGKFDCSGTQSNIAMVDAISIENKTLPITAPVCGGTAKSENGFYTCMSGAIDSTTGNLKPSQVSIALYTATNNVKTKDTSGNNIYINTKTYALNRNVVTAESVNTVSSTADWCTVPNVVGKTNAVAAADIDAVKGTADPTLKLLSNAIRTEVTATTDTVISQSPAAGTKLPCATGLVTYAY